MTHSIAGNAMVRRAIPDDARSIASIHVRAWQEAYKGVVAEDFLKSLSVERRTAIWQESLLKGDSDVWIAEEHGRALGWIALGPSRDHDADSKTAELWAIYVDPPEWRRGVGRNLWTAAETHLRSTSFREITLWVLQKNTGACKFYEKLGFSVDPGHEKTLERGGAQFVEIRLRRAL